MKTITTCRSCGADDLTTVLDLGEQYLSDFRDDDTKPARVPLEVVRCATCMLVQLRPTADPADLYHDRYSFKSGVNEGIRRDLAGIVRHAMQWRPRPAWWLDIASNDGTLLSYVPDDIFRVGIDPLAQFAPEARRHADRIIVDFFRPDRLTGCRFDVITSISMFYDLDDPSAFVKGVAEVLATDGVWIIQQNDLRTMLGGNAIDNVSHEHLAYWSLGALLPLLARHGLEVNDVSHSPVNGGCMRTVVSHAGVYPVTASVGGQLADEIKAGLDGLLVWAEFGSRTAKLLVDLRELVLKITAETGRVYVYGAGTRGGVIWQAAGLDHHHLPKVVDRNPAKVGKTMSAIGAPIISEEQARAEQPAAMLVGPYWFRDAFVERERDYLAAGGRLIFPLPELEVVGTPPA